MQRLHVKTHHNYKSIENLLTTIVMRNSFLLLFFCMLLFTACEVDYEGHYDFWVKNESSKALTLRFTHENDTLYNPSDTLPILLNPGEEKVVRYIHLGWATFPSDIINAEFETFFQGIIFDTYVDGEKLDQQLWLPEYWSYERTSEWGARYSMTITEDMLLPSEE